MDGPVKVKPKEELPKQKAYSADQLLEDFTLNTLLESLAEGVVITSEGGRIVMINERFAQLTGYEKQEVIGENLSIFLPDGMGPKHEQHVGGYFEQPRIRPIGAELNLIVKRKDNTLFPVEISLSYLSTETGKLGIAFITDISARKKAEEELKTRNHELDAYARNVAHDLNTPLIGLIGFSDLLLDSGDELPEDTRKEYLQIIAESGRKMISIVKELLVFATIKKEDVHFSNINMKVNLENVISRLRFEIEQKSAQINVEVPILDCSGSEPWIEEVWYNYISNAIKYGGTPPVIKIGSEEQESGYIKYYVEDNGQGISPKLKAIVFQSNNPEKDQMSHGFGLGLTIVKSIVEKLGGYVDVESEEGSGSTFGFYLKKE